MQAQGRNYQSWGLTRETINRGEQSAGNHRSSKQGKTVDRGEIPGVQTISRENNHQSRNNHHSQKTPSSSSSGFQLLRTSSVVVSPRFTAKFEDTASDLI
ncbi:hypothetical protein KP509_26G025100 [Ceratopteris richardii]|uniref:Uncharacterized protein n=1 Tax=Ceratopteris richardii TaxID=49495 RepID=A0A8T2RLL0_CERRI|nr:hypothetical protein KP509_26G025100 [Ceratopteris richardii]